MERRSQSKRAYAGFLMCPSGHVEEGETIGQALNREMNEELGIIVTNFRLLFGIDDIDPRSQEGFRHNFMLIESYQGTLVKSNEAKELEWLTYKQVKERSVLPIVRKLADRLHEARLF